jgi:signal transduction histidine kinase/CheY-like chemotaxis protein/HPt (histidine-containing phosphotransfer) domain-containing protein
MPKQFIYDHSIKIKRLNLAFSTLNFANISQLISGLVLVYFLKDMINKQTLTYWFSGLIISVSFGLSLRYYFNTHFDTNKITLNKWENYFFIAVLLSALIWGSAGILLFTNNSLIHQFYLEILLLGVVSASISFLTCYLRASYLFIILTLCPLALHVFLLNTENSTILTLLIVTYLISAIIGAHKFNKFILENLKLSFESNLQDEKINESEEKFKTLYKQAEQASQAKSVFLANMSHEIRTPMNGVIGNTSMLLLNPLSNEQKQRAQAIRSSADSMLSLINDILDFSKIEAGMLHVEHHDFNFNNFIDDFSSSIINSVHAKGLSLNCIIAPELKCWFKGDSNRIRQILYNLVNNSIKFTEQGGITIECSPSYSNSVYTIIRFQITDTGVGINTNLQKELFNRFSQADGSTTRKFGGTGLGLSICKQLTEIMGGEIKFIPLEEKGCRIAFTIRLINVEKPKNILPIEKNKITYFNAKILIVEDNITNQIVIKDMLEILNNNVDIATNGKEAITYLKRNKYDLVFMDCHMPIMDGYQATAEIREFTKSERNHNIPIIAMTASAMSGDREKCLDSGMNDYMTKPIELSIIQQKLQQWLPSLQETSKSKNLQQHNNTKGLHLFDFDAINSRLSGNHVLLVKVCKTFINSSTKNIESLSNALKNKDLEKLKKLTHGIKGTSATVGCTKLFHYAEKLEKIIKNNDYSEINLHFNELKKCFNDSIQAINLKLNSLSNLT